MGETLTLLSGDGDEFRHSDEVPDLSAIETRVTESLRQKVSAYPVGKRALFSVVFGLPETGPLTEPGSEKLAKIYPFHRN